jgi:hypothetical protein
MRILEIFGDFSPMSTFWVLGCFSLNGWMGCNLITDTARKDKGYNGTIWYMIEQRRKPG